MTVGRPGAASTGGAWRPNAREVRGNWGAVTVVASTAGAHDRAPNWEPSAMHRDKNDVRPRVDISFDH